MSSKSLLLFLSAAVALSAGTVAHADGRDHHSRDRDHGQRRSDHRDSRGRRDDHDRGRRWDSHGHSVWSRDFPRAHFYVGHRPPPMRYEHRSFRPSSRHYWIPGCWRWRAGYADWIWVNGYWDLPPYQHYVYVGPRYLEDGGRVVYVEGGWSEPSYAQSGETNGTVLGAGNGNAIGPEADQESAERRNLGQQPGSVGVASDSQPEAPVLQTNQPPTDPELAAAQERARAAKAKLAEAKAARDAAEAKAVALKKANDEADAAEAELKAVRP